MYICYTRLLIFPLAEIYSMNCSFTVTSEIISIFSKGISFVAHFTSPESDNPFLDHR